MMLDLLSVTVYLHKTLVLFILSARSFFFQSYRRIKQCSEIEYGSRICRPRELL